MQGAKGIHPARVDPAVEFGPLLGEEPAVRDIRLRTRQVDRAVRRVVVADHEHRQNCSGLRFPRPVGVVEQVELCLAYCVDGDRSVTPELETP